MSLEIVDFKPIENTGNFYLIKPFGDVSKKSNAEIGLCNGGLQYRDIYEAHRPDGKCNQWQGVVQVVESAISPNSNKYKSEVYVREQENLLPFEGSFHINELRLKVQDDCDNVVSTQLFPAASIGYIRKEDSQSILNSLITLPLDERGPNYVIFDGKTNIDFSDLRQIANKAPQKWVKVNGQLLSLASRENAIEMSIPTGQRHSVLEVNDKEGFEYVARKYKNTEYRQGESLRRWCEKIFAENDCEANALLRQVLNIYETNVLLQIICPFPIIKLPWQYIEGIVNKLSKGSPTSAFKMHKYLDQIGFLPTIKLASPEDNRAIRLANKHS